MGTTKFKAFTICFGLIMALVVVSTQIFSYDSALPKPKKNKTEKHSEEKDTQNSEYKYAPTSSSLPSSQHVEINHESVFICEILFEKEKTETPIYISRALGKFFKTLFSVTIAPNAP